MKRGVKSIKEYKLPRVIVSEIVGVRHLSWNPKTNLRNQALLSLLAVSGLRVSEVLKLEKEQFTYEEDFMVIKNVKVLKKRDKATMNEIPIRMSGVYEPIVKIIIEYLDTKKKGPIFKISRARAWQIVTGLTGKWCHYYRSQRISFLVNTLKGGAASAGKVMKVVPSTVAHYYTTDWRNHKEEIL